jgi:hypothetical protein
MARLLAQTAAGDVVYVFHGMKVKTGINLAELTIKQLSFRG